MIYPTISKLSLARHCTAWTGEKGSEPGEAAQRGTRIHEAIEAHIKGDAYFLADAEENLIFQSWLDWWSKHDFTYDTHFSELVMCYDGQTPAIYPNRGGRDYADLVGLCGTADFVVDLGESYLVADWKTGMYKPADESDQLMALGSIVSLLGGKDVELLMLGLDTMGFHESRAYIHQDEARRYLRRVWAELHTNPQPRPGAHCTGEYCPALGKCKAYRDYLDQKHPFPWAGCEGYEVAEFLDFKGQTEKYLKERGELIKKATDEAGGSIDLGGGMEYRRSYQVRESLDTKAMKAEIDCEKWLKTQEITVYKAVKKK